LNRDISLN
jgi:hypothetical protein